MTTFDDVIHSIDKDTLNIKVSTELYSKESIFRACYWYTDKCYLFLEKGSNHINIFFKPKPTQSIDLKTLASEFLNELINQKVRSDVTNETGKIRELIVAQAFAEVNLLPDDNVGVPKDDYLADPLGIGSLKGK